MPSAPVEPVPAKVLYIGLMPHGAGGMNGPTFGMGGFGDLEFSRAQEIIDGEYTGKVFLHGRHVAWWRTIAAMPPNYDNTITIDGVTYGGEQEGGRRRRRSSRHTRRRRTHRRRISRRRH